MAAPSDSADDAANRPAKKQRSATCKWLGPPHPWNEEPGDWANKYLEWSKQQRAEAPEPSSMQEEDEEEEDREDDEVVEDHEEEEDNDEDGKRDPSPPRGSFREFLQAASTLFDEQHTMATYSHHKVKEAAVQEGNSGSKQRCHCPIVDCHEIPIGRCQQCGGVYCMDHMHREMRLCEFCAHGGLEKELGPPLECGTEDGLLIYGWVKNDYGLWVRNPKWLKRYYAAMGQGKSLEEAMEYADGIVLITREPGAFPLSERKELGHALEFGAPLDLGARKLRAINCAVQTGTKSWNKQRRLLGLDVTSVQDHHRLFHWSGQTQACVPGKDLAAIAYALREGDLEEEFDDDVQRASRILKKMAFKWRSAYHTDDETDAMDKNLLNHLKESHWQDLA